MNISNVNFYSSPKASFPSRSRRPMPPQSSPNSWMEKLHQFFDQQLSLDSLSNRELAQLMCLSERQLYRRVQKMTGKTPNKYFTKYRMQKALAMMETGNYKTVREIAFAVGYKKDSYFSGLFKKEFGLKPLEMMRKLGIR